MQYLGIEYQMKHPPKLDASFIPFGVWREAYLKDAKQPISIAVERDRGRVSVHHTFIHGTPEMRDADYRYVERYVKFLLWSIGGFKVSICGCPELTKRLQDAYTPTGERQFDCTFVQQMYEKDLQILDLPLDACPAANEQAEPMGGNMDGCRIGFDAGGSDRKVSAVIDGECVYSEEVVWFPKLNEDPDYHYGHILEAFKTAASKMPRVDAIGVSSAGDYIDNEPRVASLFIKVPRENWDKVKTIYTRAAAAIGNVPLVVANDGDVSALAGAIGLDAGKLMGLAMGTSEAVGYVDADKNVLGWINELAFAPVDLQAGAMQDEWSTDFGVGCKYFSQDVQKLMEADDPRAQAIFETIGAYFAYTMVLYSQFYDLDYMMLMGRVMSGKGGDTILKVCNDILAEEYPALAAKCKVTLPDEKMRRVGQAVAAASLPKIQ